MARSTSNASSAGSRRAILVLSAALLTLLPFMNRPASAEVQWRSGARSAPSPMQPGELGEAMANLAARPEQKRAVVHFDGPLDEGRRGAFEASGVRLLSYLGGYAYFANLGGVDAVKASTLGGIVAVEAIEPVNKLHPDLALGIVRPWSIVPAKPGDDRQGDGESPAESDPTVAVYVLLHRDADASQEAPRLIARHAGEIRSFIRTVNGLVAHLPMSRMPDLAAEDAVMYVEPPLPLFIEINDSNRPRVGADLLQDLPYGLDGAGVGVLVYDGGKAFNHGDLAGRLTIGASDTSGTSDHATHVSCTVGGDGSGSGGQYRGMAPGVEIVSYGFEQEGGLQQGFLYTDPGDLEADYTEAITVYGADISNNSIGTNTASNGFPCEWEGNYGVTGALIDEMVRGLAGEPFRIVWANGNERSTGNCGSTYHTTAPPACAKNHITVGALNSNDDSVTSFTSWGPSDDGRLKPNVSAPGCESGGDGGVTSCSSSGGYNTKCGTSMASPTTAGVSALLLQQYRQTFPGEPDFRNSTLKVILAQTAEDLVTPGPDYQTGYGSIRAVPAADLIIDKRLVEAEVAQGETYTFLVLVGSGDNELKVTVAWDDPAGTPDVNPVLVNDLDLRVVDPGGTTHYPWTLDPDNPAEPAVRTQRDGVNNIEQVVIDNPTPGAYRVEIEGFNIAEGPTQSFSAVAAPSLINCAPAGIVTTGAGRIACSADLGIQVIDCDLNTDDGEAETISVDVVSGSEPGGETVLLTETAPESAAFQGSIAVDTADAPGVLLVADGETVTVTYVDADDGAGGIDVPVTRDVIVDCSPPNITDVSVTEINPRDATVAIAADEPVRITLPYGADCGLLTDSAASLGLDAIHQIKLTSLTDDTTYFFTAQAEDEAGNTSSDDNGGACYSFTTLEVPEFFTEQFGSGVDLEGLSVTFTPNGSGDFYAACAETLLAGLPTDPAGGAGLGLGDDQPTSFQLGGEATVGLYGQSYGTVHVGPNGYLTFGSGDSTYSESLSSHFSLPRVAALFDDLNPGIGGSVSWLQLGDRVAVTWENVPEYGTSNSNTFQIEMFFDGRIRLSWVEVDTGDAVVGLSAGQGLDPDFFESDLSESLACGPRPPFVQDIVVGTNVGDAIGIGLTANDDGLPEPPALSYRVAGLPSFGTLSDPATGAPIIEVPYDLDGDVVTYQPFIGYHGSDGFTYKADDGGVPPDGGESESGAVAITITVGEPEILREFLVDDTDPGWSTTGDWDFGQPAGGGSNAGDPTSGFTGDNVYGYNLAGDYADNMGEEYLTTPPLDLSRVSGAMLRFHRWLGVGSSFQDHARVQISADGINWSTVWNHIGPSISENEWSLQGYNVSAVADGEPEVRIRWTMGGTNGFGTFPGWNLDDVRIIGVFNATCTKTPDEVSNLKFSADRQTLAWIPSLEIGEDPPAYDTIRSTSPSDFVSAAICVESDDGSDTEATDMEDPGSGQVFYYLVRAENDCGSGPLGQASSGSDRTALTCTP